MATTDAFWAKVDKGGECWLWTGSRNAQGYGRFWRNGKVRRAHRVSYELAIGAIPAGRIICHRCDTPACVRPEHLFAGTYRDNAADCIAKGRFSYRASPDLKKCQRGHEFTPENTISNSGGKRKCRACQRARRRGVRE